MVKTKAKVLELNKGVTESISDLLKHLLESGKVKGVFALNQLSENKAGEALSYSLITSKDAITNVAPLYPIMPRNGGGLASFLTQKGEISGPTPYGKPIHNKLDMWRCLSN
jgi:hypothetical protein